jgi:hypothetical protein
MGMMNITPNRFIDNTGINKTMDNQEYQTYRSRRNAYWRRLRAAQGEFNTLKNNNIAAKNTVFKDYVLDKYGVGMHFEDGGIAGRFDIIDDVKYFLFLIKFPV